MAVNIILPILAGAIAGAVAGGLLAWCVTRHFPRLSHPVPEPPLIDQDVLRDIDRAAKAWADSHDQSETAAGLVADKLRLVYELTQRRNRP